MVTAYVVALGLATVGIALSGVVMVETATYALAVGGSLFCTLAVAADVLTLTMPSVIGAMWHRRSPAVIVAVLLWCASMAVTVANLGWLRGRACRTRPGGTGDDGHRAQHGDGPAGAAAG
jgi:hypothetical protein